LQTSAAHVATGASETARLYEKYARQLYRYCLARLRSPEEAEDAVQNTFIRVHGALQNGTKPRFEAAWLYKIAHNVCLTRIEIRGRRAEHELPADLDDLDVAAPETEKEALIGLEAALGSMPKNLRDAILLREWQGLSYAEIAESLETSVPAVETLIFRARRHLAAALQPVAGVGLLDVGTLYWAVRIALARLRGVFGTLGPAKVAVGVAAVTLGTAGVTTVLADGEAHPPGHDPAAVSTVVGAVPAANVTGVAGVSTTRTTPKASAPTPRVTSKPAAHHIVAGVSPTPTAAAATAGPTAADAPTETPTTTATEPTQTPIAPLVPTPSIPTPTTPTIATPTVQVPTAVPTEPVATLPALPTTVATPAVTVPALLP
jgi:RNA polymerase sigma factor (sigma-70 family)